MSGIETDCFEDPELGGENDPEYQRDVFGMIRVTLEGVFDRKCAANYADG
jgi:hypothetical protein